MGLFGYGNCGRQPVTQNVAPAENSIARFLRTLSPGTPVVLQYNSQKPAKGIYQGFQNGNLVLSNFNGFPGLTRINPNRVNAVSVGKEYCKD